MEKIVKEDEVVRRFCTAPGVGPVTATTFAATIDDATRFGANQVRHANERAASSAKSCIIVMPDLCVHMMHVAI